MVIGITGGIATGKSTVTRMFQDLGAAAVSADEIARDVLAPGSPALREVVREFGPGVLLSDGSLDRAALGKIVFESTDALEKINRITHPRIIAVMKERIDAFRASAGPAEVFAAEIPLLFECDMTAMVDKIVVVSAEQDEQMNRLTTRGLSTAEAERRIGAQMSLEDKIGHADWVVGTDTSIDDTRRQVERIWRDVLQSNRG